MGRLILLYIMVISIPLSLSVSAWQANRCQALKKEMARLDREQERLLDTNKQLITEIAGLSSAARIEEFARGALGMDKKNPEDVLQIYIANGRNAKDTRGGGGRYGK